MAVSRLWPVKTRLNQVIEYAMNPEKTGRSRTKYSNGDYQALKDVLAYAKNEEKTEHEYFCEGINCYPDTAREQFVRVKKQFNKTDGIQAYHGYLSFKEQDITPEEAQAIGMEFAKEVWGDRYQVVVTTHLNTKHLHCHFVINSVSFVDGKRCRDTSWYKFRKTADRICEEHGLYFNPEPERHRESSFLHHEETEGEPTRYNNIREAIDYAIDHSRSLVEFDYVLNRLGYEHNLSPTRKYWTITPKGRTKSVRLRSLGDDYTNDRIVERIKEHHGVIMEDFQRPDYYRQRQYDLPVREDKIRQNTKGLRCLWLVYCCRLGAMPKYLKPNSARVHYLLKDDLTRLDELTEQVTLLSKNKIETQDDLEKYKEGVERKIKELTDKRTRLRNKERRKGLTDGELKDIRKRITDITRELKPLRKEVRLCDGIAERSGVLRERLEAVEKDEQKYKAKEVRNNERGK